MACFAVLGFFLLLNAVWRFPTFLNTDIFRLNLLSPGLFLIQITVAARNATARCFTRVYFMTAEPQYSLTQMIFGGSPVVQIVLLVLVVLSVYSWAITIAKWLYFKKARKDTQEFFRIFSETRDLSRIDDSARRLMASPVVGVFVAGYKEIVRILQEHRDGKKLSSAHAIMLVESALERAQVDESSRLEKGSVFLATTASAAPFIGLFGTVWGIMNAFRGLSLQKTSTIQAVAPGISEALIATAVGLAAAIPAAIAFNYITSAVKSYRRSMRTFADQFAGLARQEVETTKQDV